MEEYTLLNEIKRCRGTFDVDIERANGNRFRVLCRDSENELSAYYFSCPIYRDIDKKMISFEFCKSGDTFIFNGINATVQVGEEFTLSNAYGKIKFDGLNTAKAEPVLTQDMFGNKRKALHVKNHREEILIFPTCNGIAIQVTAENADKMQRLKLLTEKKYGLWGNGRYSALMIEDRQPYATVNALCAKSDRFNHAVPIFCEMTETYYGYDLKIDLHNAGNLENSKITYSFTIDLYASKSIFDTTVESANPDINNSYGGIAYIGNSKFFKEQWLYTRIDPAQILDLKYFSVKRARLYAKKYDGDNPKVSIARMNTPWCSFGNTWNTKTEIGALINQARLERNYLTADITEVVREMLRQGGDPDAGIVLKPEAAERLSMVVATADNYYTPQILEIKLQTD